MYLITLLVFRKSLQVSSSAKKDTTSGEIVNLMSVDCQEKLHNEPNYP